MNANYNDILEALLLLRHHDPKRFQDILIIIIRKLTDEICEMINGKN